MQPERGRGKEGQGIIFFPSSSFSAFPSNFFLPHCPLRPMWLAGGALCGDHLGAWTVWDRWADDGYDVIDSGVMDDWLADRGLMQYRGHCRTADGLAIDKTDEQINKKSTPLWWTENQNEIKKGAQRESGAVFLPSQGVALLCRRWLSRAKEYCVAVVCRHGSVITHVYWGGLGAGYMRQEREFCWYGVAGDSRGWWYAISSDGQQLDCGGEIGHSSKLAVVGCDGMIGQQRALLGVWR